MWENGRHDIRTDLWIDFVYREIAIWIKNVKIDIYYPRIRLSLWIITAHNYVNFVLHCQLTKNWFWRFCFRSRTIIYLIVIYLTLTSRIAVDYLHMFYSNLFCCRNITNLVNPTMKIKNINPQIDPNSAL